MNPEKSKVGIIDPPQCESHKQDYSIPEKPERVKVIREALRLLDKQKYPTYNINTEPITGSNITLNEIHSKEYIEHVKHVCSIGGFISGSSEVVVRQGKSYPSIVYAAGAAITAVDHVLQGYGSKVFCNVRPPGHHAKCGKGSGFCVFNNIALAAQHALENYESVSKVCIIDWDVHHGDGTQSIFEDNPNVMYVSWHQGWDCFGRPFYPGTGKRTETGKHNNISNHPMMPGHGDEEYMYEFNSIIKNKIETFEPNIILISCGFDGCISESISQIKLTPEFYYNMTKELCVLAKKYCKGRVISVLEGGYNLETIGKCAENHVRGLFDI